MDTGDEKKLLRLFNGELTKEEEREIEPLVIDFNSKLLAYARSLTKNLEQAEDLVQETFRKVMEKRETFDGKNLTAWIKTILRNTFLDTTRKIKERELTEEMDIEIEGEQESDLIEKDLERCLGELKALEREIISLKGRGHSYKEISEFAGKSENNLRVIMLRSRKQLATCLEGYSG